MEPVLAMALGAGETTPFRMTAAYAAFVNGGRKVIPAPDRAGGGPRRRADLQGRPSRLPRLRRRLHRRRRTRPAAGGDADHRSDHRLSDRPPCCEGVVQHGTAVAGPACSAGRSAARPAPPTISAAPGSWASRRRSSSASLSGFDDNRSLGKGETGAVAAVPIFIEFMQEALKGMPKMRLQGARRTPSIA